MTSDPADVDVELPGAAPLITRLQSLLHGPQTVEPRAETSRGWLDLAYEAAYGERYAAAAEAAQAGLDAAGSEDPDNRLMLLRILSGVHEMRGDTGASSPYVIERVALLRRLGRTRQARIEEELGAMLLREPDHVEGEILARVAEQLRDEDAATGAPTLELADVLSSQAVRVLHDEGPEAALPVVEEAVDILTRLDRPEALAGARMFLAHTLLLTGDSARALQVTDDVMGAPANRAVRGAMAMLRATIHHHDDKPHEAITDAISSVELYAACGVRKGAASAAALLAGLSSAVDEGEASVLAWKVAVQQAELGEFPESRMLTLALGQQLLELERFDEAEKVLDALSVRLASSEEDIAVRARSLMGLGHSVTQQKRPLEAMAHWEEAAELFLSAQELEESARARLAAGALAASLERFEAAETHHRKALELARRAQDDDPAILVQALHALGHLLTRTEDPDGVDLLQEALKVAQEHGTDWQVADITDSLARGYVSLGEGSAAVARALDAADLFLAAGDDRSAGGAEILAGKVLLEMGRADEAEAILRMAVGDRQAEHDLVAEALEGRIDALMRQGKADEAAELRRELTRLKRRMKP
ncbi:tetratricopeptide repeat protein [Nesterenkonia xinjiangensis]|uniref:Tetratricopeptide (TPR) repeat protein n=1 Tax=Nesterenkonia xinjiangensis TaxID=225327 RepID=A0A7Z0GJ07_9MICC|nr:tetratricopeptide repeat protein [Nesterenkonia xinjiangensis]NYJ76886.1 tetratricopeptide (TPR) repeat protein [Nesterenkonia xinjiangensis]